MGHLIGIDLGTTFSAVAVMGELGRPEIITNREGENITPSVVLFQSDTTLVGTMAKRSAAMAPLDTVQFVKRAMGDATWRFETTDGVTFRPEEISALIIKRLKEDAELHLGGPVDQAVITVPAYFDDGARRATKDAGTIAGLTVHRVLNEPTAAALAYGLDTADAGTVLVYDLGGGTFDVTVMRIENREFTTVATNGDRNLGGFDWDNALMNLLNARFQELGGPDLLDDDHTEADLREKAETAKRALTTIQKTKVVLSAGGTTRTVEVTRKDFEEATSSLLSRTRDLTAILLEDAGLSWSDVDTVLLAGGSTRMPMVREMMESFSGRKPERAFNPDEVVALGAAVQAHIVDVERTGTKSALPAITIRDVTSQGLGILIRADTGNMENAVIIAPNTRIPAKHTDSFRTVSDNQTEIRVSVTQGDDADPSFVKVIGEQILPIPAHPAGAPVDVTFAYDIDQTVFIEVADLTTNRSLGTFEVHDVSNMDSAEKDLATGKIRALEVS
ncbi:Hsp70 family protein [Lentzea kentuckyensis]|uniref:Hsp70 family protein n=1 Tax=Lentzea kentuckyensis TaxID=360086 RepID=UPI000A3A691E|nr:Hsp70 family protein [Lentzea kentuckyensis]